MKLEKTKAPELFVLRSKYMKISMISKSKPHHLMITNAETQRCSELSKKLNASP